MRAFPFTFLRGLLGLSTFLRFRGESPAAGDDTAGYRIGDDIGAIMAGGEDGIAMEAFTPEAALSRLKLRSRTRFAGVSDAN